MENSPSPLNPEPRTLPPAPPILMGILNLTPDSFSDGGRFLDPAAAEEQALKLEADGADLLDLGAESTRPGHELVSEEEELRRLLPVLDRLAGQLKIPISVDTSKAAVARAAFDHGAAILNDVAALSRPGMADFARAGEFPLILMHGVAHVLAEDDPAPSATIAAWLAARIAELGIAKERLVLDPGIGFGFGKTPAQNLELLRRLDELHDLGFPLLLGASRKSFIGKVLDLPPPERLEGTLASTTLAVAQGVAIVRVHDVQANLRAARTAEAILHA